MPIFEYKALTSSGKTKKGIVDADTARDTRRHCGVAGTPLQPTPATPCQPDNPRRA